jgi:TolA-binding protein
MANKPLNISESAAVQMPMKTVASLIVLVAMGVFAYTELTSRLVSLETSRELMSADLLKKSEQVPVDQEQLMLLEDLYKTTEKIETRIEDMMHNKVNIQFVTKQLEKALEDIEVLKDKVRANGKSY